MSKREPLMVNGQKLGRLKGSWMLFKESWNYLKADKEMVWIPVITSLLNLLLFGILIVLFVFVVLGGDFALSAEGEPTTPIEWALIFCVYVIGAFTLALSQAGIAHTVSTRAHGGDATLGQALKSAFSHWTSLLAWSLITSTVGLILRMIAERSQIIGKIVVLLLGTAWSVLTYFVVPAMVLDNKSAFSSIGKSSQVFKATWGETLVSNVSLGLTFLLAHFIVLVATIGLAIFVSSVDPLLMISVFILYGIWFVAACLVQATLEGVLKTLLYIYAAEGVYPPNFNQELLQKMLASNKQTPAQPTIPSEQTPTNPTV